jgi:hypothetical protein
MQHYAIFFIAVNALHVSGDFSAHHQDLKIQNCTHYIWDMPSLLAAAASLVNSNSPMLVAAASKLPNTR